MPTTSTLSHWWSPQSARGGRSIKTNEAHVFHLRDGKVVEFWNASFDPYAFDELIG